MPVSADQFRRALRRWASGVSIVTTRGEAGIQGITVASFCSLSLDPPLVLICIGRATRSHARIEGGGAFAVNILRAEQAHLSDGAAGRTADRETWLEGARFREVATGAPVLEGCLAWLDCKLVERHDGGDHSIFVGRVEAAGTGGGKPLLWFMSGYRRLAARRSGPRRRGAPRSRR
ncbi:MAG: flavin reductase family protein [Acidobacteriota bacterium]